VNNALEQIRLLGNCSNKGHYEYTDEEISKIFGALETSLQECKGKFDLEKKRLFSLGE